ncbi:3-isopropylmalate dehydratase large subunit [Roseomonas sp. CGMCC 1.13459]|uniref:3-isopropylmalate dehydratase large subunit n=1 Tax=Falsiroseomonas oleicola TaxID=2801474 RepID=A0ABS6H7M5_9PROT|nr:3-isopropylmalate dehydratase large subunit [Roseomonas oleicola]MBU8544704.1 3-isopropylmalate dehydratase large subunit [Roseomonas oleicola]
MGQTLFQKIWDAHVVQARDDGLALLYVDRHYFHEGSFHAFNMLKARGLAVRRPDLTFGFGDHYAPTVGRSTPEVKDPEIRGIIETFEENARANRIRAFELADPDQGIVHVAGPEQGLTLPGMTVVCGDSHTSTHGALGALAFGIGASEVAHVLATQTIWQSPPKQIRCSFDGELPAGSTSKDMALALIAHIGTGGGLGGAIEFAGTAVRALSVEARLTLCNMAIEAGARTGMVAPDAVTAAWLAGRPYAPAQRDPAWDRLFSDPDARFDSEVTLDAANIRPMATWGTSPEEAVPLSGRVPRAEEAPDEARQKAWARSLDYMGLRGGEAMADVALDRVFLGSCTNARIEDLRDAAAVLRGRRIAVPMLVSPGSSRVKRAAEAEGLDRIFKEAGARWEESSCALCVSMHGETVGEGERCASTSNRNFAGRQGRGARTHLVSPASAAASAVAGRLVSAL